VVITEIKLKQNKSKTMFCFSEIISFQFYFRCNHCLSVKSMFEKCAQAAKLNVFSIESESEALLKALSNRMLRLSVAMHCFSLLYTLYFLLF